MSTENNDKNDEGEYYYADKEGWYRFLTVCKNSKLKEVRNIAHYIEVKMNSATTGIIQTFIIDLDTIFAPKDDEEKKYFSEHRVEAQKRIESIFDDMQQAKFVIKEWKKEVEGERVKYILTSINEFFKRTEDDGQTVTNK